MARWRYKRSKAALKILRYYRRFKVKSYIKEVVRRFNGVRNSRDYGKNVKWPTPPKVLRSFQEFLQRAFHRYSGTTGSEIKQNFTVISIAAKNAFLVYRWRAYHLLKTIPPADIPKIKAKVAAFENLKGQRADLGLQRRWEGSYLALVGAWQSLLWFFFFQCSSKSAVVLIFSIACIRNRRTAKTQRYLYPEPMSCRGKTSSCSLSSPAMYARYASMELCDVTLLCVASYREITVRTS